MTNGCKLFLFSSMISLCIHTNAENTGVRESGVQLDTTEVVSTSLTAIAEEVPLIEPTASTATTPVAEEVAIATPPTAPVEEKGNYGKASFYEYYLPSGWSSRDHLVCASRDYPRGSILLVTNIANGRTVECKVTDYGPNKTVHPDRIIDLSPSAFEAIGDLRSGIIEVSVSKI